MDFDDTEQEAQFRAEVKAWLADNVPSKAELEGLDDIAQAKLWQKRKYDAGWACIRWPEEFGGRNASAIETSFSTRRNLNTIHLRGYSSLATACVHLQ